MPDFTDLPVSVAVGLRIAVIIVAGVAAYVAVRIAVGVAIRQLLERRAADEAEPMSAELDRRVKTVASLVLRISGSVIAVIAGLMALDQFGIDIGPAVAGLGVAGIALGFGAQTLVRDWLAGIFVIVENQYNQGDVVRIAGVEGVVEDLSLRRTTLRDLDGTLHTVPNGQIVVASNMTRLWARVNLDVSVAYDTDIDRATGIIDRIGVELQADPVWGPRMLEAPTVVRVNALADSAVTLKILGQVQPAQQWAVAGELRKRVLAGFAREGIQIPFPHRVIVNSSGPGAETGTTASERGAQEAAAASDE
jgi:small conductance mechanosensitive channel